MPSGSCRSSLASLPFPSTGPAAAAAANGAMGNGACLLEPCISSSKGSHLLPDASGTPTCCPRACTMRRIMSSAFKPLGASHGQGLQQAADSVQVHPWHLVNRARSSTSSALRPVSWSALRCSPDNIRDGHRGCLQQKLRGSLQAGAGPAAAQPQHLLACFVAAGAARQHPHQQMRLLTCKHCERTQEAASSLIHMTLSSGTRHSYIQDSQLICQNIGQVWE